jgi:hypothetical protein
MINLFGQRIAGSAHCDGMARREFLRIGGMAAGGLSLAQLLRLDALADIRLPASGGAFKHGQHLAFDKQRNYPLPNLYLSMLERIGIESDKFASSTGTMRGLEMA